MIWRTAKEDTCLGSKEVKAGTKVILGLASALTDKSASDSLMFGGYQKTRPENGEAVTEATVTGKLNIREPVTVHGCPGYEMAIGVLLALTSALLEAAPLRPTGSSIQLTLIRPAS